MEKIRAYNQSFAFTSFGASVHNFTNGPPTFRIQGQVSHRIGALLPLEGAIPSYSQIYFFDTNFDQELSARGRHFPTLCIRTVSRIQGILHNLNPSDYSIYSSHLFNIKSKQARQSSNYRNVRLSLSSNLPGLDQRRYNTPTVSQVRLTLQTVMNK
jgi:hypothetical protein